MDKFFRFAKEEEAAAVVEEEGEEKFSETWRNGLVVWPKPAFTIRRRWGFRGTRAVSAGEGARKVVRAPRKGLHTLSSTREACAPIRNRLRASICAAL
jgi:hypothetical protein